MSLITVDDSALQILLWLSTVGFPKHHDATQSEKTIMHQNG